VDAFHRKLPIFEGIWVDEIHENMRKIAPFGWTHKLLPSDRSRYTDKTGILELKFEGFVLPPGWEWQGEWKSKVVPGATDNEGWRYASSFGSTVEWHNQEEAKDFVRTRKMQRRRVYTGNVPKVEQKKFLLYVDAIEAKDVLSKDFGSESDPYLQISLKSKDPQTQRTRHLNNTKSPVWKETLWYEVSLEDILVAECVDFDDVGKDDTIGSAEISVQQIVSKNLKDIWLDITDKKKKVTGSVHLGFSK